MRRGFTVAWIMAGVAVIGVMTAGGGGEARAGTIGITINGGFKPVAGDPPYLYILDVYLDPGFEVKANDLFTVFDLNGVTNGSLTHQPPPPGQSPAVAWVPDPELDQTTWTFLGTSVIQNTNPVGSNIEVYLGQFEVLTTEDFPPGTTPVPPNNPTTYTFQISDLNGDPVSGGGTFPMVDLGAVPEPSSIVLLALGVAALPAIAARRRHRRIAGTA
jgi:hypothetical protein